MKVCSLITSWNNYLLKDESKYVLYDDEIGYTRKEIEIFSGKVYNFLHKKGIGNEDFVFIDLPRTSKFYILMLGVLKSGAAFVVSENNLAVERKKYLEKITKCKISITEETLNEIVNQSYLEGCNKVNEHNAAFAIFTSGTSGTPKGIIHEYGKLELIWQSFLDEKTGDFRENEATRFLNVIPFNFVASILVFTLWLKSGGCVLTPTYEVIKNTSEFEKYSKTFKPNEMFVTPSFFPLIKEKLNPEMELIYTGSESANNISFERGSLYNLYLMSETAYVLCTYKIEEPELLCPVGKSNRIASISLSGEGEIICNNPYCRGYIDSQDSENFHDGLFNTEDIGKTNEDGLIILTGRKTDTIKINGNRIEPLEIETLINKYFNIKECAIKKVEDGSKTFLCLFYVAEEEIDVSLVQKTLNDLLPYYMIPSVIVRLQNLPRTKIGKLDRKELPNPVIGIKDVKSEPMSEMQKKLLNVFIKILNIEDISIDVDLFAFGLDSLGVIQAVSNIEIDELNYSDIYELRTIRNIEKRILERQNDNISFTEMEMIGRKDVYPLFSTTLIFFLLQTLSPDCSSLNLSVCLKINESINLEKLCQSINNVLSNSSSFSTRIIMNEQGVPCFKYDPSSFKPAIIEEMNEKQVEELRKNFVKPFKLLSELPWRMRLIKSIENYLFLDMHHCFIDGFGLATLVESFFLDYFGKIYARNNFFEYCYKIDAIQKTENFQLKVKYLIEEYGNKNWGTILELNDEKERTAHIVCDTGISLNSLDSFLRENKISRGTLFISALHIARRRLTGIDKNIVKWCYVNRSSTGNQAASRFVMMLHSVTISDDMSIINVFNEVSEEINKNIKLFCSGDLIDLGPTMIVFNDLADVNNPKGFLNDVVEKIELERPFDCVDGQSQKYTAVNVFNKDGNLWIKFDTDNKRMKRDERERFVKSYIDILYRLINLDNGVIKSIE